MNSITEFLKSLTEILNAQTATLESIATIAASIRFLLILILIVLGALLALFVWKILRPFLVAAKNFAAALFSKIRAKIGK